MGRKIAYWLALAVLLFTGVMGIYNGITEWGEGEGVWQISVTVGVFAYGVFGLLTAHAVMLRKTWAIRSALGWAIAVTYVPAVAIMSYDDKASLGSALAASVASALIAVFVLWATRVREPAVGAAT